MGAIVTVKGKKTDDMLSIKEAAVMLGAGVSTVNNWVATGKIPACKVTGSKAHYILVDDLNDFEQNGSFRARNRKKTKKVKTPEDILNTMTKKQQELFLEAYASTARLLAMTFDIDQIGVIKATLSDILNNSETLSNLVNNAPEIMEDHVS